MSTITLNDDITISLSVKDRAASIRWYSTHLGFKELFSNDAMGWSEMSTNTKGVTLGFGDAEAASPGNCVPVFGVSDIDAARTALEAKDVRFDGDTMTIDGMAKIATFFDPDGNALMLAETLASGQDA
ncbi:MAG: VOC family protein [Myxococcota bacterium]